MQTQAIDAAAPQSPTLSRIRPKELAIGHELANAAFADAEFERLLALAFQQRSARSAGENEQARLGARHETEFSAQRQKEGDKA